MIKGILFDMDGLMIDSENVTFHILRDILKEKGYEMNKDMYLQLVGKTKTTCVSIFKNWYGEDYDYWGMSAFLAPILNETLAKNLPIKPGLFELLEYCKMHGIKTCIATSSTRSKLDAILPPSLFSYFNDTICGDEVVNGKPNPEVFLKACEKLGLTYDEALVLEDSEAGIEASIAGGIKVVCIPDMKEPSEWHKTRLSGYYSDLTGVISYLEKENNQ